MRDNKIEPQKNMPAIDRHLIVGIDPGTSVGMAVLDVDGNILGVESRRNITLDETITALSKYGKTTVIASDKAIAPAAVSKLASLLGARVYTPDYDLPVEKKRQLCSKRKTQNDHERDSLSAALYAYYHFQNKIRRVGRQIDTEKEAIKARVLKGEKVSDILAFREAASEKPDLEPQLAALRKENAQLRGRIESLERARPKSPASVLREAAAEARKLVNDVSEGRLIMLREVPTLTFFDLKSSNPRIGDVLITQSKDFDSKGLRFLEARRVAGIVSPKKIDTLVPNCTFDDLEVLSWETLFFAEPKELERACKRKREVGARDLRDMLLEYKKGRR